MQQYNYKCKPCNPTVLNPEFPLKCKFCIHLPVIIKKGQSCGISEINLFEKRINHEK